MCYRCVDTQEEFTTTQTDTYNTSQIYNSYRAEHGIPFPDEIREVRSRYGLSALKMSRILGFGDNQYRLYENGEIPNVANGRVLKAIQSAKTFETFVDAARNVLSEAEYASIKKRLEECVNQTYMDRAVYMLIGGGNERSRYNGYSLLSKSRLKNAMLFYIEMFKGVFATQMNKLLFYTDFLSYRESGQTIMGLTFRAIQYGPVPDRWNRIYSLLDDICEVEVECANGNVGNMLVSEMPCDRSSFTDGQLAILERVYETFRNDTPAIISAKSHQEPAWVENKDKHSLIDYRYAFSLKAV
ncbi:MAG: DUF4065 domain-containing protein [Prevotella sp.]|nr:DUF4065 domain-containing protein [Prevotella sp.]